MDYVLTELIMIKKNLHGLYKTFNRKKIVNTTQDTQLLKILSTVDLIALGVGSILQYFMFMLIMIWLFYDFSTIISITIATIISMFTGLCYAELSAQMPHAGSTYIYSYVTMGEFVAFFTGWTMILKYAVDSAVTGRILSFLINKIFYENSKEKEFITLESCITFQLSYPAIFAFGLTLIFSAVFASRTKMSCVLNNILLLSKLSIDIIIILIMSFTVGTKYLKKEHHFVNATFFNEAITSTNDEITYIIQDAITFFITFIGFDCVSTMGEEAKNPRRSIPRAIIISITIVYFIYFGLFVCIVHYKSIFQSFIKPETLNNKWIKCILMIEIISGFYTSLLGSRLSLRQVFYAMGSDGLIFKSPGHVNPRFQTRIKGTLIVGLCTGILAIIFHTDSLKSVRYVCTMVLYSMVALCIIILRYEENESYRRQDESSDNPQTFMSVMKQLVNANRLSRPTKLTAQIVNVLLCCYVILCICTVSLLSVPGVERAQFEPNFEKERATNVMLLIILTTALVIILCFIYFQPVSDKKLTFSVPLVPFLPGFSIFLNIYIIKIYYSLIWIKFFLWMAIGLGVYFLYGIWHSNMRQTEPPPESNNDDNNDDTAL